MTVGFLWIANFFDTLGLLETAMSATDVVIQKKFLGAEKYGLGITVLIIPNQKNGRFYENN